MTNTGDSVANARIISEFIMKEGYSAEHPATAPEIGKQFGIHPSHVRGCVNMARCMGIPICANSKGYWYSNDVSEIESTIEHMEDRIKKQANAVSGLKAAIGR